MRGMFGDKPGEPVRRKKYETPPVHAGGQPSREAVERQKADQRRAEERRAANGSSTAKTAENFVEVSGGFSNKERKNKRWEKKYGSGGVAQPDSTGPENNPDPGHSPTHTEEGRVLFKNDREPVVISPAEAEQLASQVVDRTIGETLRSGDLNNEQQLVFAQPGVREGLVNKIKNSKVFETSWSGALRAFAVGGAVGGTIGYKVAISMAVSKCVRTYINIAAPGVGAIAGGVAGASFEGGMGLYKEIKRTRGERKNYREELENLHGVERVRRALELHDQADIAHMESTDSHAHRILEQLAASKINWNKVGKRALRGAIIGAVGGAACTYLFEHFHVFENLKHVFGGNHGAQPSLEHAALGADNARHIVPTAGNAPSPALHHGTPVHEWGVHPQPPPDVLVTQPISADTVQPMDHHNMWSTVKDYLQHQGHIDNPSNELVNQATRKLAEINGVQIMADGGQLAAGKVADTAMQAGFPIHHFEVLNDLITQAGGSPEIITSTVHIPLPVSPGFEHLPGAGFYHGEIPTSVSRFGVDTTELSNIIRTLATAAEAGFGVGAIGFGGFMLAKHHKDKKQKKSLRETLGGGGDGAAAQPIKRGFMPGNIQTLGLIDHSRTVSPGRAEPLAAAIPIIAGLDVPTGPESALRQENLLTEKLHGTIDQLELAIIQAEQAVDGFNVSPGQVSQCIKEAEKLAGEVGVMVNPLPRQRAAGIPAEFYNKCYQDTKDRRDGLKARLKSAKEKAARRPKPATAAQASPDTTAIIPDEIIAAPKVEPVAAAEKAKDVIIDVKNVEISDQEAVRNLQGRFDAWKFHIQEMANALAAGNLKKYDALTDLEAEIHRELEDSGLNPGRGEPNRVAKKEGCSRHQPELDSLDQQLETLREKRQKITEAVIDIPNAATPAPEKNEAAETIRNELTEALDNLEMAINSAGALFPEKLSECRFRLHDKTGEVYVAVGNFDRTTKRHKDSAGYKTAIAPLHSRINDARHQFRILTKKLLRLEEDRAGKLKTGDSLPPVSGEAVTRQGETPENTAAEINTAFAKVDSLVSALISGNKNNPDAQDAVVNAWPQLDDFDHGTELSEKERYLYGGACEQFLNRLANEGLSDVANRVWKKILPGVESPFKDTATEEPPTQDTGIDDSDDDSPKTPTAESQTVPVQATAEVLPTGVPLAHLDLPETWRAEKKSRKRALPKTERPNRKAEADPDIPAWRRHLIDQAHEKGIYEKKKDEAENVWVQLMQPLEHGGILQIAVGRGISSEEALSIRHTLEGVPDFRNVSDIEPLVNIFRMLDDNLDRQLAPVQTLRRYLMNLAPVMRTAREEAKSSPSAENKEELAVK